ncbi:hypothetical protein CIP107544_02373 [Corynebacterium diphtheriae]|nr:hypothetical protein CIP107544_02373 [Corynebacterium diphtheriae]
MSNPREIDLEQNTHQERGLIHMSIDTFLKMVPEFRISATSGLAGASSGAEFAIIYSLSS